MKFLKVTGWIFVPYIMVFIRWKKIGAKGRVMGISWAVIVLLIGITNSSEPTKSTMSNPEVKEESKTAANTATDDEKKKKEDEEKAQASALEKEKAEAELKAEEAKAKVEANKPENFANRVAHKAFGEKNAYDQTDSVVDLNFNSDNGFLLIKVFAQTDLKRSMWLGVNNALKALKDRTDIKTVAFQLMLPLQDKFGKITVSNVMKLEFSPETRNQIVWETFDWRKIPDIAENYWEHPAIQD